MRRSSSVRRVLRLLVIYARLVIVALIVLYPVIWAVSTALKDRREFDVNPLGLVPIDLTMVNFVEAWNRGSLQQYTLNSICVAVPTVLLGLLISVLAGYALARIRMPFGFAIYTSIVVGLAIPIELLIIPLFIQMLDWGLINNFLSVILPTVALMVPFGTLLMRNFFLDFPQELADAAKIDGCNELQVLWRVFVPNMAPGVSALGVFLFLSSWNMFLLPIVMITDTTMRTIPTGLANFVGQYALSVTWLMAGAIIASIPVIIVYIIFQRHFVQGLMSGAVRG